MSDKLTAIKDLMLKRDAFSKWLGIEIDEYDAGYCKLHYTVREDMINGFHIVHGGVVFSAADSAFAFACNSHGRITVALDVHIAYARAGRPGDVMTVEAKEVHNGNKTAFYHIITTNQHNEVIATFNGTAYKTSKEILE